MFIPHPPYISLPATGIKYHLFDGSWRDTGRPLPAHLYPASVLCDRSLSDLLWAAMITVSNSADFLFPPGPYTFLRTTASPFNLRDRVGGNNPVPRSYSLCSSNALLVPSMSHPRKLLVVTTVVSAPQGRQRNQYAAGLIIANVIKYQHLCPLSIPGSPSPAAIDYFYTGLIHLNIIRNQRLRASGRNNHIGIFPFHKIPLSHSYELLHYIFLTGILNIDKPLYFCPVGHLLNQKDLSA